MRPKIVDRVRVEAAVKQDERAPFVQALQRARVAAYAPGEFVEQESFMRAQRDPGPGRAGRHRTRGLGARPVLRRRRARDGSSRGSSVAAYLGVDSSASAIDIARERAGGLPCRFEVARVPPLPPGPFDVVLLLETMLAFPEKETLLEGISGALRPGGRFAFTMEEGLPLTEAERERMPDADTVWLTPLEEMLACLERAGLRRPLAGGLQRVPPRHGGVAARRVRRRCAGHRRADRAPGAAGAAGRPPALERLAARRTGPQDRVRGGEGIVTADNTSTGPDGLPPMVRPTTLSERPVFHKLRSLKVAIRGLPPRVPRAALGHRGLSPRLCNTSASTSAIRARRPGHPLGLRRVHGIAQMRDTHTGDDCRIPEDDRCVREVVEQPHSCA